MKRNMSESAHAEMEKKYPTDDKASAKKSVKAVRKDGTPDEMSRVCDAACRKHGDMMSMMDMDKE